MYYIKDKRTRRRPKRELYFIMCCIRVSGEYRAVSFRVAAGLYFYFLLQDVWCRMLYCKWWAWPAFYKPAGLKRSRAPGICYIIIPKQVCKTGSKGNPLLLPYFWYEAAPACRRIGAAVTGGPVAESSFSWKLSYISSKPDISSFKFNNFLYFFLLILIILNKNK